MSEKTYKADIMIVDDVPENLKVLFSILTYAGYKVRSVLKSTLALEIAPQVKPDMILLDIRMPDMDGFDLCAALRQHPDLTNVPLMFISAQSQDTDAEKVHQSQAVDYIMKPFAADEVLAKVEKYLALSA